MKVRDLIGILSELDADALVFVAVQPSWPFEHVLQGVAVRRDFTEMEDDEEDADGPVDRWSADAGRLPGNDVLIVAGEQLRYGNGDAWDALRRR